MKRPHYTHSTLQLALLIALQTGMHQAAIAEESSGAAQVATKQYTIPAGELATSLQTLASESGVILTFTPEQTSGKQSKALNGRYTVEQAFDTLLTGTGLAAKKNQNNQYSLIKSPSLSNASTANQAGSTTQLPEVAVTTHAESANKLPPDYAGGQTARGGRLGLLGNKDILDTPFSVTQYTAKLIEDQQAQSIGDVLVNDPSVRNTYSRSSGRDEFNIRGFTLFNYDVLYNGLYGVTPRNTSSLIGIERIEVLRGPNALLNGMAPAGSVGGSINLVPKRAGTTPLNRLTLSHIDDSQLETHIDVARRFGEEQQLGVRVNAMTSSGDTPVDNAKESLDAIAIGLDFQGERLRIEGDFNYQHRNTQGRGGLLFAPSTGRIASAPDADKNFIQKWTYWKTNEVSGAVRAEFDVTPAWTLYGALGGKEYDFKSLQTQMQLQNTQGLLAFRPYRLDESIKNLSAEAGAKGKFTTGPVEHELVLSINSFSQENRLLRSPNVPFAFSNIYSPVNFSEPTLVLSGNLPKTSESRLRSLAIADTISLADRKVQLTLGARHQQVEASNFNGTTGIRTDHYDKSDLTPAVALVIRPTEQLSFYGNYIEALNQGSTAPTGATNAGQMFAPAVSKQHEAGVKYDFGRFATTLSAFQIERPAGFTDPTTQRFDMDGEQRNRGIELITQGEAIDHVRVLGGLAWTQGKLTQTEGGTNDGNTAPAVPRLQFNLAGEWDTPIVPGLTLTARMVHTSPQYVNAENTQKIPTWTRYDLGARYAFVAGKTPITMRGTIENLFDKNYWLSAAREGLTVGAPRTVLLSVSADF
ncbi:TonB-dependent receptor [Methylobacillus caricis]|uniref:TonB-dependent receptor n=1 Tax=Methylobacillus caricis TaxID=1971611 RepID=UPI001CFFC5C7|nr:TonB-dependent receptor [Methylobacillus caricis]MCB5187793.1 TonB-dependent receptor [Methylobacillus caricis]